MATDQNGDPALSRDLNSLNDQDVFQSVLDAIHSIRFGTVQLTIHEGRLVEIAKTIRSRPQSK
jgi:hypothetical protein